jgi:hypothetical protein
MPANVVQQAGRGLMKKELIAFLKNTYPDLRPSEDVLERPNWGRIA